MLNRRINLQREINNGNRVRSEAGDLRDVRTDLRSYHGTLQSQWKAKEMTHINNAINNLLESLSSAATELDSIGDDVIAAAHEVRRAEELAIAKAELARAEAEHNRTRQLHENAQRLYNATPSPLLEMALNQARGKLSIAADAHATALERVRALS